jgi:YidC/Oxa1 family membrane protein insertase
MWSRNRRSTRAAASSSISAVLRTQEHELCPPGRHELERIIDFGTFDLLAKPCLWLLNFLYGLIPNYGIAIIALTILTKIILWPLGTKSYKSMSQMKKLQPLIQEIGKSTRTTGRK